MAENTADARAAVRKGVIGADFRAALRSGSANREN